MEPDKVTSSESNHILWRILCIFDICDLSSSDRFCLIVYRLVAENLDIYRIFRNLSTTARNN